MTYTEFTTFIKPLAVHFSAVKDEPTWRLYHAALMRPPAPSRRLLELALPRAASTRRWFPSVEEFRADAEVERQAILASHPYKRCAECRDSAGWVTVVVEGIERVIRCPCFARYRKAVATLGVGDQPLALPAASTEAE